MVWLGSTIVVGMAGRLAWLVAVLLIVAALAACSEATTDNEMYIRIAGIMDELNGEWTAPGAATGRGWNVTDRVCRQINLVGLESLIDDPSVAGNVDFKFYEKSLTYADNSRNWTITRPLGWNEKQVGRVSVAPGDGGVAIDGRVN
mgnify:CR=1 FL=1